MKLCFGKLIWRSFTFFLIDPTNVCISVYKYEYKINFLILIPIVKKKIFS